MHFGDTSNQKKGTNLFKEESLLQCNASFKVPALQSNLPLGAVVNIESKFTGLYNRGMNLNHNYGTANIPSDPLMAYRNQIEGKIVSGNTFVSLSLSLLS